MHFKSKLLLLPIMTISLLPILSCKGRKGDTSGVAFAETNANEGTLSSGLVTYKKIGDNAFILVFQPGGKVMATLQEFQTATRTKTASITGLGFVRNTVVGFYNVSANGPQDIASAIAPANVSPFRLDTIKGGREMLNLNCNLTTRIIAADGSRLSSPPHCHIVIAGNDSNLPTGQGWPVAGGHLIETEIAATAELIVTTFDIELIKRPSSTFVGFLVDLLAG